MSPEQTEHHVYYKAHRGPRFEAAGLRVQFHGNQVPGIHLKTALREEYQAAVFKGLQDGLALRFPMFLDHGSVWIIGTEDDEADSSQEAFYGAARLVIDQAYSLAALRRQTGVAMQPDGPSTAPAMTGQIRRRMQEVPFKPFCIRTINSLEYVVPSAQHVHVFPGQKIGVSDDDGACVFLPARSISELV